MMDKKSLGCIFLMGMGGAACRYGVGLAMPGSSTQYGTLAVNLLGSFFLPAVFIWVKKRYALPSCLITGMGAGFIGSFTTFSSFSVDAVQLLERGAWHNALFYIMANLLGGLLLALLSVFLWSRALRLRSNEKAAEAGVKAIRSEGMQRGEVKPDD